VRREEALRGVEDLAPPRRIARTLDASGRHARNMTQSTVSVNSVRIEICAGGDDVALRACAAGCAVAQRHAPPSADGPGSNGSSNPAARCCVPMVPEMVPAASNDTI
jgi:hypothetical protein